MIPESLDSVVLKIMDSALATHCHRIDSSNFIEYRAPHPSKVKHTPPSPTTSGYSESGSEMDNPDSGRVSELEGSPKMQSKRPETISLNMGMFAPNQSEITSPDPFPEGKSTIKMGRGASHSENSNVVTISAQTLNTLVICLHEARMRLNRMESKMDALVKVLQLQHRHTNESAFKLSRTILALGNDFKNYKSAHRLENGRCYPQGFLSKPSREVPISCNNNNITSSASNSRKFQSSECLNSSPSSVDRSPKVPASSDNQTATFPRFVKTDTSASSVSVAPSPGKQPQESYDNLQPGATAKEHPTTEYVNDDIIRTAIPGGNDVTKSEIKVQRSPVYAVVKKKSKSAEFLGTVDDAPPELKRRSCDIMTSLHDDVNLGNDVDLEQMLREMQETKDGSVATPGDDTFSNGESLTPVSRFSEMESLMSAFESSTVFSDDKPMFDEGDEEFCTTFILEEEYDNKPGELFEEAVFSPQSGRNHNSGVMTHELPSTAASWHSAKHEMAYSNAETVRRTDHVPPKDNADTRHSFQPLSDCSPGFEAVGLESSTSINGGYSKGKVDKKAKKKTGSGKDLLENRKKGNVLVSNYNKLFKRKGKKKRSESQNSFTFVTSPLYEAELAVSSKGLSSLKRGQSADSILSNDRATFSSRSNISSSHEGSIFLSASQGQLNSPAGVERRTNRSLASIQSTANTQLLRLQSNDVFGNDCEASSIGDFDNVKPDDFEERYDNFELEDNEEMGPNLVKIVKKAFRNSPKILRRGKTPPNIQTAELKPKIPNGHACIHGPTAAPELPPREKSNPPEPPKRAPISRVDGIFEDDVFIPPGVILETQQREQADRIRFDTGHAAALDQPPPKPNRPGFNHGGGQGSPRSSLSAHPNGGVPGYPRGMPAVPPKQKIMTQEELTNHEAQEKLRMKQVEEAMLQQTLDQQQKQAAVNARWLEQEEHMLNPDTKNGEDSALRRGRGSSNSLAEMRGAMEAPPPPSVAPSKPPRKSSRPKDEPTGPPQTKLEEVKTAPTMQLNRDDDEVYKNTMEVVKAVFGMNNMTMNAKPDELFASVKTVGAALKRLCASLETVLSELPEDFHREIDMAQRTTNKDLSQVINQLKLVQRFYTTTQVVDYKKCLLAANQVLAIDAKNLLDVVDRARIRKFQTAQEQAKAQASDIRQGTTPQPAATGYVPEDIYPDGEFL